MKSKKVLIIAIIIVVLVLGIIGYFWLKPDQKTSNTVDEDIGNLDIVVTDFDVNELDQSFTRMDYYILQKSKHKQAATEAIKYIDDSNEETRFAAVYLLVNTGTSDNIDDLKPILEDNNEGIKIMAAGRLIGWGEKSAIPVLIESLKSETVIPYSQPSVPAWSLAWESLPYYTNQDFNLSTANNYEQTSATYDDWKAWWDQNQTSLNWDESNKKYQ